MANFPKGCSEIEYFDWDALLLNKNIDEACQLWETHIKSLNNGSSAQEKEVAMLELDLLLENKSSLYIAS